ncbi:MAG TPA: hypothetical protein VHB54_10035 [Mucilaginibacter sp.]|nr:hypothetical protein [Mucilaginibacter sp.]
MANTYTVTVTLDDYTLGKLKAGGYSLQVFKGVKGNPNTGQPTLWFAVTEFSSSVKLTWTEQYGGYVDNQTLANGVVVDISSAKPMDLGNLMTLNADGSTTVTANGQAGQIDIVSLQNDEWLCGMTQSLNGNAPTAICAFPLYGNQGDLMEPYETVVLMFDSAQVATGTVVEEAVSASVSILLSGSSPTATVAYDMNTSWANTNNDPYVTINPMNLALAPVLIVPRS